MSIDLRDNEIIRAGVPIGRVEKRGRRWWWFIGETQGDEPSREVALQVARMFLASEERPR